jgi:hypothetical protein
MPFYAQIAYTKIFNMSVHVRYAQVDVFVFCFGPEGQMHILLEMRVFRYICPTIHESLAFFESRQNSQNMLMQSALEFHVSSAHHATDIEDPQVRGFWRETRHTGHYHIIRMPLLE